MKHCWVAWNRLGSLGSEPNKIIIQPCNNGFKQHTGDDQASEPDECTYKMECERTQQERNQIAKSGGSSVVRPTRCMNAHTHYIRTYARAPACACICTSLHACRKATSAKSKRLHIRLNTMCPDERYVQTAHGLIAATVTEGSPPQPHRNKGKGPAQRRSQNSHPQFIVDGDEVLCGRRTRTPLVAPWGRGNDEDLSCVVV